jgi:hypothetical protein
MRRRISLLATPLVIATSLSACGPIISSEDCGVAGEMTVGVGGNVSLTEPSGDTRSVSFASGSTGVSARSVGGTYASSACASGVTIVVSDENGPTVSLSIQAFQGPGPYDLSELEACEQRCPGCAGDPLDMYPYVAPDAGTIPPTPCVPVEGTLTLSSSSTTSPETGTYSSMTVDSTTVIVAIASSSRPPLSGTLDLSATQASYVEMSSIIGGCPPPPGS